MAFLHRHRIRFDDVDYARIVFYPRIFVFCQHAFEALLEREAPLPLHRIIEERQVGFPIVHTEADYKAPLALGDECQIQLEVERLSERSVTFRFHLWKDGTTLCARVQVVHAILDIGRFAPCALPDDLKAVFARHLVEA